MVAATLTCLLLGACEDGGSDGGTPATQQALLLKPSPGATPRMTPVDASPTCLVRSEVPFGEEPLTFEALWPVNDGGVLEQPTQTLAVAVDAEDCPGELPPEPSCDRPAPWTKLSPDAFFTASGSRRLVEGSITADPRARGQGASASGSATRSRPVVEQSVAFTALEFAADDQRLVGDFLEAAVIRCADAGPVDIGGRVVLVGRVASRYRSGPAEIVLVTAPRGVLWLVVDGTSAVAARDRDRLVAAAVDRLLPR